MNKWFNKQTIVSFILGGILFSSAGVFAATQLNIVPNTFPIKINNNEVDLEAYNIEGITYLQLRDTTEVLNAELDFKDNTIYINTNNVSGDDNISESTPIPIITSIPTPTSVDINTNKESEVNKMNDKPTKTSDRLTIFYYDKSINRYSKTSGIPYIQLVEILSIYKESGFYIETNDNIGKLFNSQNAEPILIDIPLEQIDVFTMIKYDYYQNNIEPLLQKRG